MACTEAAPTPSEPTATPAPVATPTLQPTPTSRPTATPSPTPTPTPTPIPIPVGVGPSPIAAGSGHTCGLQADGTAVCWGDDSSGQSSPREGRFISISASSSGTCALRTDGSPACWGNTEESLYEDQRFVLLDLGYYYSGSCGIRIDGSAFCQSSAASIAPSGRLTTISVGVEHSCALRESGVAVCWGDEDAQQDRPSEDERYIAIGAGYNYTCALRLDGSPTCWGLDNKWKSAAPKNEEFAYLSVGRFRTCALRKDGTAACWNEDGLVTKGYSFDLRPPQGERFTHISVGTFHICGVRVDGYSVCWGDNSDGEASPPGGVRLATPSDLRGFSRQGQTLASANSLPTAIAQVARSVVRIEVPLERYSSAAGTGVIVDVDTQTGAAQLLTAYHVIEERPSGIIVTAEDEANIKEYDARIVAYDSALDIALLSICCSSTFLAAELSGELAESGEQAFVIGYGKYDENATVSQGRVIGTRGGFPGAQIGTTADVVEGDSGGPLISGQTGEVIGIMLSVVVESIRWPKGTSIALSSPDVISALLPQRPAATPTPRPTPTPTATPTPTPTPVASATSMNEWAFGTINPTTGTRIAYAYVENSPYSLYIRCVSDQLDMFVAWGRNITSNSTVQVFHKVGYQPTKRLLWDLSPDSQSTFFPANILESTIQQMYEAHEFEVSVQPDQELILLTATFKTQEMYEAVRPVLEACS